MRAIFSDDCRSELEKLAREGKVVARYLYATWEPVKTIGQLAYRRSIIKPLDDLKPGAFERHAEWHLNAIEFTHANLHEGETAGLVAFGESYVSGKFTSPNHFLGMALLRAALYCEPHLRRIEPLVLVLSTGTDLDKLVLDEETISAKLALADELSAYCL